jgi:aminomethyltransferase
VNNLEGKERMSDRNVKRTVFNQYHHDLGARMVDFGGWEMPLQYSKIIPEHSCVRSAVGLFDVSHMGEVFFEGPGALAAVRAMVTNDLAIEDGEAQYTCLCKHNGGIIDDLIVYRLSESRILLCINASNREKDYEWLREHNPDRRVEVVNASDEYAQVAIQGRHAEALLQKLTPLPLAGLKYYGLSEAVVDGIEGCIIARTGYTGEDGFEVFLPAAGGGGIWPKLLELGEEFGILPIGLAARDTLRLEARMNLYGSDMDESHTPYEAGLGWTVKLGKGDFIGKAALEEFKQSQWKKRLVGMVVQKRIPRHGCPIIADGKAVGQVTSGTRSPSLGTGIALGHVPRALSRAGTRLEIDVRGRLAEATVVKGPFYARNY